MLKHNKIKIESTLLTILISIFSITPSIAQDGVKVSIDSLKSIILLNNRDRQEVDAYSRLCYEHRSIDTSLGLNYGFKGLELSKNLGYQKGQANCLLSIGTNYFTSKSFDKALDYYQDALDLNRRNGDLDAISLNLSYIAHLHSRLSNYPTLLKNLNEILEISRKNGDSSKIADELNNIGLVNLYNSTYTQALVALNESLLINSALNDTLNMGFNLINIGRVYIAIEDYDESLDFLFRGLKNFKIVKDIRNTLRSYNFISEVYSKQGNFLEANRYLDLALNGIPEDNEAKEYSKTLLLKSQLDLMGSQFKEAIKYANMSIRHSKKIFFKDGQAEGYLNRGKIYLSLANINNNQKNLILAKKDFLMADSIFNDVGELKLRSETLLNLSEVSDLMNRTKESLEYYKLHIQLKDSIFNEDNLKKIGKLESDLEYKLKLSESERRRLIAEQEQLVSENRTQLLMLGMIALLIIIILILWLFNIRRKNHIKLKNNYDQIQQQKIELEDKKEQLLKMNIAKDKLFGTISHDLRNAFKGFVVGTDNLKNKSNLDNNEEVTLLNQYAKKMNDLLVSLFEYSDKHFNELEIELSNVDISRLLDSVLDQFSNDITLKQLNIIKDYKHDSANTNSTYLVIALRNIIHNAIKFSYEGSEIKITIFSEDGYSIIIISDNGIGMNENDIDKVINYQRPNVKMPIGDYDKGNGFGLITSKEIIDKLNGSLYLKPIKPSGLSIHIYLPN